MALVTARAGRGWLIPRRCCQSLRPPRWRPRVRPRTGVLRDSFPLPPCTGRFGKDRSAGFPDAESRNRRARARTHRSVCPALPRTPRLDQRAARSRGEIGQHLAVVIGHACDVHADCSEAVPPFTQFDELTLAEGSPVCGAVEQDQESLVPHEIEERAPLAGVGNELTGRYPGAGGRPPLVGVIRRQGKARAE